METEAATDSKGRCLTIGFNEEIQSAYVDADSVTNFPTALKVSAF